MGLREPDETHVRGYAASREGARLIVLRAPDEPLLDLRERAWNLIGGKCLYTIYDDRASARQA